MAHYSKSQFFVQKFNFDKTPTFSRVFHPKIFLTIFLVKSKLSTAKKSKTTTFSWVFHPNFFWQFFSWNQSCQQLKSPKSQHFHEFFTQKSTIFTGSQSWIFGQKMKISNSVLNLQMTFQPFNKVQCAFTIFLAQQQFYGQFKWPWHKIVVALASHRYQRSSAFSQMEPCNNCLLHNRHLWCFSFISWMECQFSIPI